MTLPAHRFLDREDRAKEQTPGIDQQPPYVWAFDIDETLTIAPAQYARLSEALRANGDKVVVVTGHGPRNSREELLKAIGFEYDDIVIVEPGENGEGKAECLQHLGAFFCFEDSVQFGPEIVKVCPVTFQYREPAGDIKPKKAAKKAAKILKVGKDNQPG